VKVFYACFILFFYVATIHSHAQEISFRDTVAAYNASRLKINKTGMDVLGAWGLANVAAGGVGYFTAKQDEWKYFHAMNALWGLTNTGIAALGLAGARKEMDAKLNANQSYDRYRANKRLYLVNAALDVVYIATGVGLAAYSTTAKNNVALFRGFGKSIALQGVFLLIFDNCMFAAHQRYNSKWFRLMNEIRVSNTSVAFNYTL